MNWKKKTPAEIADADKRKDYTNGYEFFPWLWHMRKMYLLGFFGNLILGWSGGIASMTPEADNELWISYAIIGFFGVFAPTLIGLLLRRDFKESKKGISR